MRIEIKTLEAFSPIELYDYLQLRSEVFVVEQQCIYLDMDGKDQKALHVLGYSEEGILLGCTRIFGPGDYLEDASIGRVAVRKTHRGEGLGKKIVEASMNAIQARFGSGQITLSAQTYLKAFYRDLGFVEIGDTYLEDGIPHILMQR